MGITKIEVTSLQGFSEKIIQSISNAGGTIALDFSLSNFYIVNGGNCTLNLINISQCQTIYIILNSNGLAYNIAWTCPDAIIRWSNGSAPVFTNAVANTKKDIVSLIRINNELFGSFLLNL